MFTINTNAAATVNTNSVTATADNRPSFFRRVVSAALVIGALTFAANAFAQDAKGASRAKSDGEHTILVNPLSPSDPRAKLDPESLKARPMPAPVYLTSGAELGTEANALVEYNVSEGVAADRSLNPVAVPNFVADAVTSGKASLAGSTGANLVQDNADERRSRPKTNSVIGADDRIKITNTAAYPWRAFTKLVMTFPSGNAFICSGTMVNAKYMLTAGHCVYSRSEGGWARSIKVIPGLNGTYEPYGHTWATMMRTYTGWTNDQSADHDFALVTLADPIGASTGWLGLKVYSAMDGLFGNLAGYQGDRDGGTSLYYHFGSVQSSTAFRAFYAIDTAGGQSGSGVYHIENGSRYLFAVHAYGDNGSGQNGGTRINDSKFSSIVSWMASGN